MKGLLLFIILLSFFKPTSAALPDAILKALEQHSAVFKEEELKKVTVETTECDAECGLGIKMETRCYINGATGERTECENVKVECHGIYECDIRRQHYDLGETFLLDCQTEELVAHEEENVVYIWKMAPGIITQEDPLFNRLVGRTRILTFSNIQESDAGSYRCQMEDNEHKLLKVVYYGVQVTNSDVLDMNVQRLQEKEAVEEATKDKSQRPWLMNSFRLQVIAIAGAGIGSGVLTLVVVVIVYRNISRKRREQSEFEP